MNKRLQEMEDAIQNINDTIKKSDLDVKLNVITDEDGTYRIYNSSDDVNDILNSPEPTESCLLVADEQVDAFLANQDGIAKLVNSGVINDDNIDWKKISDSVFVVLHLTKKEEEPKDSETEKPDNQIDDELDDLDIETPEGEDLQTASYSLTICGKEFMITDENKNVYGYGTYNPKLIKTMESLYGKFKKNTIFENIDTEKTKNEVSEAKKNLVELVSDFGGKMIFRNNVVTCNENTLSVKEATIDEIAQCPSATNSSVFDKWALADSRLAARSKMKIQAESFNKTKSIMNFKRSSDTISTSTGVKHVVAETNDFSAVMPFDVVQHLCKISYVSKNGKCSAYPNDECLSLQNETIGIQAYNIKKVAQMLAEWFEAIGDESCKATTKMIERSIKFAEENKEYKDLILVGCCNNLYDHILENFDQKKFAKLKIVTESYKKTAAEMLIQNENVDLFSMLSSKHLEYLKTNESKDYERKYSNEAYDEILNIKNVKNENLHMAVSTLAMLVLETSDRIDSLSQKERKCIQNVVFDENIQYGNKLRNFAFILSSLLDKSQDARVVETMENGLMACHMLSLKCIEREAE